MTHYVTSDGNDYCPAETHKKINNNNKIIIYRFFNLIKDTEKSLLL